MDLIAAMRIMTEVTRLGSFTAAGQELRLSTASISRIVAELEEDFGVRLINRTTRQLSPTDAGEEFVQRSLGILEELEALRSTVRERHEVPRGRLRVTCVTAFGNECLAPAIPGFLERFPQLKVSLDISNRLVDLIEEHYDVAIRVGPLRDSSLVAQKIFTQRLIFVASPEFCRRHGMPKSLDEIRSYPSVMQISGEWGRVQHFKRGADIIEFEAPQDCVMNSPSAVRNAALTGYGYTLSGDFTVAKDIAEGRLVRLLPDYEPVEQHLYAVFAHRRYMPRKVRAFVDYLNEIFGERSQ